MSTGEDGLGLGALRPIQGVFKKDPGGPPHGVFENFVALWNFVRGIIRNFRVHSEWGVVILGF